MDILKERDPEEEAAEPLAGPVGKAENCWTCCLMNTGPKSF
jgi:hypothetical protein